MSKTESKKKFRTSFSGVNGEEFNLESYLCESANIIRGNVDASDFKAYIFPLLFYKRISDVYDEEYQKALDDSSNDEDYAKSEVNHRFQIPNGCHWSDLRKHTKNIGQYLQKSLREIEKINPQRLFGIFGDTNWGNKEKLTDEVMINLIEHFSKVILNNEKIEPDILGRAYEYLIKRFADLTNRKAGEFYTPRNVVRLLTEIIDPDDSDSIYDPACGTGGMLLEAVACVKRKNQDIRKLKLFGQESNLNTASISRINLFLHGFDDFSIVRGDTLRNPAFHKNDKLLKFDCVIANPPYSLREWGLEVWKNDPYNRPFAGMPPESFGDFAWIQHMICSAKDDGKIAVVISNSALSRPHEKHIRENLIKQDLISAIIQLGPNLFYGTNISPCILIFNKCKTKEKNKIFLINASTIFEKGRAQNYLHDHHVEKILDIYRNKHEIAHLSKIISADDVEKNSWNLNVSKYVVANPTLDIIPLKDALSETKVAYDDFKSSEQLLKKSLIKYGVLIK